MGEVARMIPDWVLNTIIIIAVPLSVMYTVRKRANNGK